MSTPSITYFFISLDKYCNSLSNPAYSSCFFLISNWSCLFSFFFPGKFESYKRIFPLLGFPFEASYLLNLLKLELPVSWGERNFEGSNFLVRKENLSIGWFFISFGVEAKSPSEDSDYSLSSSGLSLFSFCFSAFYAS